MKILQINSMANEGCVARIACGINKEILKSENEGIIAFARGSVPGNIETIQIGSKIDFYTHALYSRLFDSQGYGSKKATNKFIKELKLCNPDIIHLHNIHGSYINVPMLFEKLKEIDVPVVWTLHDCWAFTGHCSYYDYVKCSKWKKECYECGRKKDYPKSYFIDNSRKNFRLKKEMFTGLKKMVLVTPSNWLKNEISYSFLRHYPIKVINNGINMDNFKPIESDFRVKNNLKNKIILLGVANYWHNIKGFKDFVNLANDLDNRYQIILVGGISRKQKNILNKNVIVINRTNDIQELIELYSTADLFVNPTHEDNFPTTNLEALACGTPVITYRTGGSIEAIDEKSGYIVDNYQQLLKVIEQYDINKISSLDCLERAKSYNQEKKFKEYVELYEEILKGGNN